MMKGYLTKFCVAMCAVALALAFVSCKKSGENVGYEKKGEAPDFTLVDLQGASVSLSKLKGRVVLVEFWATWCYPCRESVPELNDLYTKYKDREFTILGISVDRGGDAALRVASFVREHRVLYPVLLDNKETYKLYDVSGIPAIFIIDKNGVMVKRYSGFAPGFAESIAKEVEVLL